MSVKDAVALRFQELCGERGIRFNELAVRSGVTPSTVYSMMHSRRRELSINVIKKLCDELDLSLKDFFSADVFEELDQEIQ